MAHFSVLPPEINGMDTGQCAAPLADRGPYGVDDVRLCHNRSSPVASEWYPHRIVVDTGHFRLPLW